MPPIKNRPPWYKTKIGMTQMAKETDPLTAPFAADCWWMRLDGSKIQDSGREEMRHALHLALQRIAARDSVPTTKKRKRTSVAMDAMPDDEIARGLLSGLRFYLASLGAGEPIEMRVVRPLLHRILQNLQN
jgi:hypothetical protein